MVSVCCTTYNHEPYIEDALEGFLIQETGFAFEILIHDDASTDKTADIIRKYEKKYPRLIKAIYQIKNQYSKGPRVDALFNFTRAKGDFIALCEGDDYWTNPKKLDIQIGEMKKHPEVGISFHSGKLLVGGKIGKDVANYGHKNKIYSTSEVIRGDGGFSPTNSLIIRKIKLLNLPKWFMTKHQ